jgi:AcrR family transcriptional regulator
VSDLRYEIAGRSGSSPPTRERLLHAARELIEEGGYAAASVVAITGRAGLAAGTLYRHFRSKEELFVQVFRTVCERELAVMAEAARSGGKSPSARLETVLLTFAERALRRPRLAWALLAEPVDPLVDGARLAYRSRYAELIAGLLTEAVAAGELPEQDITLTAAALVGACAEALVGPLAALGPRPRAQRTVQALRAFTRRAVGAPAPAVTAA